MGRRRRAIRDPADLDAPDARSEPAAVPTLGTGARDLVCAHDIGGALLGGGAQIEVVLDRLTLDLPPGLGDVELQLLGRGRSHRTAV